MESRILLGPGLWAPELLGVSCSNQLSSFIIDNYSLTDIVSNVTKSSNACDTYFVSNTCIELSNVLHVLCISRTNNCFML